MTELVLIISVLLLAGSLAALISEVLSVPRTFCFISAGLVLSSLGISRSSLVLLAQLSGLFVVFSTGSRLLPQTVLSRGSYSSIVSAGLKTGVIWSFSVAAALFSGFGVFTSMFVGLAAAVTSTAEAVGAVGKEAERKLSHARIAETSSLFEDTVAVSFLGYVSGGLSGFLGVLLAVGGAFAARSRIGSVLEGLDASEEVYLFLAVLVSVGSVAAGEVLSFGLAAGALAAGVAFSQYPADVQILESIKPLEIFFSAVFFVSLGALFVPTAESLGLAAIIFIGMSVVGPVVTCALLYILGRNLHQSVQASLSLCAISEIVLFAVVTVTSASTDLASGVIAASLLASFTSGMLSDSSDKIYHFVEQLVTESGEREVDSSGHVIVLGYGLTGKKVAEGLDDVVVVDNDRSMVEEAAEDYVAVLGDGRDRRTWKRCNVKEADAVVSTVESDAISESVAALDASVKKYCLTESEKDSSMLDLTMAAKPQNLYADRIGDRLAHGLEEDFGSLKEELRQELRSLNDKQ